MKKEITMSKYAFNNTIDEIVKLIFNTKVTPVKAELVEAKREIEYLKSVIKAKEARADIAEAVSAGYEADDFEFYASNGVRFDKAGLGYGPGEIFPSINGISKNGNYYMVRHSAGGTRHYIASCSTFMKAVEAKFNAEVEFSGEVSDTSAYRYLLSKHVIDEDGCYWE